MKNLKTYQEKDKAAFLNLIADELLALDNHLIKPTVAKQDCQKAELKVGEGEQFFSREVLQNW